MNCLLILEALINRRKGRLINRRKRISISLVFKIEKKLNFRKKVLQKSTHMKDYESPKEY